MSNLKSYSSSEFPQYRNGIDGAKHDFDFSLYFSTDSTLQENECMKVALKGISKSKFGSGPLASMSFMEGMWEQHFNDLLKWKGPLLVVKAAGKRLELVWILD